MAWVICHLLVSLCQAGTLRDHANLIARKQNQTAAKCHADTHPSNLGFSASLFLLLHNPGHLTYTHYINCIIIIQFPSRTSLSEASLIC